MDRGREKGKGERKGKGCELCPGTARMYCESDEAMLCWECDARVHGANFLVARHTRALLCRTCQSPTPWRASGSRLGPSVSLCNRCSPHSQSPADDIRRGGGEAGARSESESEDEEDDDVEEDGDGEDSAEEMEDSAEEGEEEGENQVVPWSPPPPTPLTSSSSSEEEEEEEEEESSRTEIGAGSGGGSGSSLKRMRDNADLASHPQDDLPSSSMQLSRFPSDQPPFSARAAATDTDGDEATSVGRRGGSNSAGFRLPKDRRRLPGHLVGSDPAAQPTGSARRSQPPAVGELCGPSRAAISTISFVQAT